MPPEQAVGKIHRPENAGRKGQEQTQRLEARAALARVRKQMNMMLKANRDFLWLAQNLILADDAELCKTIELIKSPVKSDG